jgi:hypothetical protein
MNPDDDDLAALRVQVARNSLQPFEGVMERPSALRQGGVDLDRLDIGGANFGTAIPSPLRPLFM